MAGSRIPGPLGLNSPRGSIDQFTRQPVSRPGTIGLENDSSSDREREIEKNEIALDLCQLILDITGIIDPTPVSDGTNALVSLTRGKWVDAVISAVSIVPYVGDLAKLGKLPRYLNSIRKAIRIAKADAKWSMVLRKLFIQLKKMIDQLYELGADKLPDNTNSTLKQIKREIDDFLSSPSSVGNATPKNTARNVIDNRPRSTSLRGKHSGETKMTNLKKAKLGESIVKQQFDVLKHQGHGPQRHEGDVTPKQLEDRCIKGIDPMSGTTKDAVTGKTHKYSRNATKINSPEDYVKAENHIRSSKEFERKVQLAEGSGKNRIVVNESKLNEIYGPDYSSKVAGKTRVGPSKTPQGVKSTTFTDESKMVGVYKKSTDGNWELLTMYPDP